MDLFSFSCHLTKSAELFDTLSMHPSLLSYCTVDYACSAAAAVQWATLGRLRNWQATIDNWHLLLGTTLSVWVYFDDVRYVCCCCPSNCSNFLKCVYCWSLNVVNQIYAHFSPLKLCETVFFWAFCCSSVYVGAQRWLRFFQLHRRLSLKRIFEWTAVS